MKHSAILITITSLVALAYSCTNIAVSNSMMSELDKAINRRTEYIDRHRHEMDSLKSAIQTRKSKREIWDIYKTLHTRYSTFSVDSAALYASKMEATATQISDKELIFRSKVARITALHALFEYGEGRKLFENLDTTGIRIESMAEYWSLGSRLYRDHLKYMESTDQERKEYERHLNELRKELSQRGYYVSRDCRLKTALMHIDHGEWEKACNILYDVQQEEGLSIHEQAVTAYYLSKAYKLTEDHDRRKHSLIKAATLDLTMANRESFAMWELSQMLFQDGDFDRASEYMTLTLNEALACNFKVLYMRAIEAKELIVHTIHENHVKMNRVLLGGIILTLLALGVISYMLAYSNRQRRRVAKANDMIKSMNRKLAKVNSELKDANQIKDNYVSLYMKLSTQYIRQVDEERSHLRKIAKAEGLEGIMKVLRAPKYADEECKRFYEIFDRTFMGLFPHFIEEVNELLPPKAQLSPKSDGSLSTELRILAAIRLGITKSPEIADVLNCAIRTVYKYRTTLRCLAICDKDQFEEKVRVCG